MLESSEDIISRNKESKEIIDNFCNLFYGCVERWEKRINDIQVSRSYVAKIARISAPTVFAIFSKKIGVSLRSFCAIEQAIIALEETSLTQKSTYFNQFGRRFREFDFSIVDDVQRCMKELDLTVDDLAERCLLCRSTVVSFLSKTSVPRKKTSEKIINYFSNVYRDMEAQDKQ